MKRIITLVLTAIMLLSVVSCSKNQTSSSSGGNTDISKTGYGIAEEYLNNMEYSTYQDIFYNETGDTYTGKSFTKEGIFTTLRDSFNNQDRYYVWGFNDNTHCCDWQWELKITDTSNLPKNGSLVEFEGVFTADSKALDGYWFTEPKITVKKEYTGSDVDYDLTTLSATLARVQLINMVNYPDEYNGKTIKVIGRVKDTNTIQHPYYDEAWDLPVTSSKALPAIGKYIVAKGTFTGTTMDDCTINITKYTEVSA